MHQGLILVQLLEANQIDQVTQPSLTCRGLGGFYGDSTVVMALGFMSSLPNCIYHAPSIMISLLLLSHSVPPTTPPINEKL